MLFVCWASTLHEASSTSFCVITLKFFSTGHMSCALSCYLSFNLQGSMCLYVLPTNLTYIYFLKFSLACAYLIFINCLSDMRNTYVQGVKSLSGQVESIKTMCCFPEPFNRNKQMFVKHLLSACVALHNVIYTATSLVQYVNYIISSKSVPISSI